ncbi:hypothetical protein MENTO_v1c03120 [Mesoplasma entomophilum]|uniref:Uncharacterized protein n=1 Tax=Mesoplasma entomophilum TaxID=2149 RepID=A0A3S5XYX6_9MOLU|nr:hypothetical protein [Mesoplasma entomophilum]ATQ35458.1 hypothetical protein CS528_01615 [Mesoplasma entomophilum]ATZ19418.1 hypothetical protein MENTO_v1c03120 [Mesoplasma entomophilum]
MSIENLKRNNIFKYKCLELIYSINKFQIEKQSWKYFDFENVLLTKLQPTELNTLTFLLRSFKELYENEDPKIFEENQNIFFFAHKFRNVNWHKDSYLSNVKDIAESMLLKKILSFDDIENINKVIDKTKKNENKILDISLIFQRNANSDLVLLLIADNIEYVYTVDESFLILVFSIFNEALINMYRFLFNDL